VDAKHQPPGADEAIPLTPWHTGPYSWEMDVIVPLRKPIPARGKLSFWKPTPYQTKDLANQVASLF